MKARNTFKRTLSLLCCLAMLMAWLPVLPAAAADPVLSEDFESVSAGSFPGDFSKSNQANDGTVNETVQSFGGSKVLQIDVQNGASAEKEARARIKTKEKWSGSYTVTWDMNNQSDKWSIFETYVRYGGYVRPRINSSGQLAFYVHANATVAGVMEGTTSNIALSTKTWYTMRVQVTDEVITFSATERDTGRQLGQISLTQSTDTYAELLQPYEFWFSFAAPTKVSDTDKYTMLIDNVMIHDGVEDIAATPATPATPSTPSASTTTVEVGSSQVGISEGKERWIIQQDDFESYSLGEDTFFNANTNDYTYVASYHGTKSDDSSASYSLYGVVNDSSGKAIKLTSVNTMRNWFVTKAGVSGSYSVQMDIKFEQPTGSTIPGFILNPFQGYEFAGGKTMLTYFYPNMIRMTDNATTGSNVHYYVKNDSGANLQIGYNTWYTIKITVAEGTYCVKAWPQGGTEPANGGSVLTVTTPAINADVLANTNNVRLYNMARSKPGEAYTTYVDNLKIYKTFDSMSVPDTLFGVPGEKLSIAPTITGQDLAGEKPALTWAYKLDNASLGSVSKKGELILGPGEGQTRLTVTLADRSGNAVGTSATATLVVGTSNGVTASPKEFKVSENDIGKTAKLTYTVGDEAKSKYPGHTVSLTSSDESVVKVAADGTVTYMGFGSATIVIKVMDGTKETAYFAAVPVQVGEQPLRILSIGNSHSRDSFYYLSYLAAAAGKRVEAAFLHKDSGTMRHHANNLVTETADYSYYKADPMTGTVKYIGKTTIQTGLADGDWDIVMLHQGTTYAGAPGTYNSDIEYVADYVKAEQPNAKLYWMLGWAYEDDFDEEHPNYTHAKNFATYYDGSQAKMYNAFIECFDQFIFGPDAKYGDLFDGWFPNGVAIQNLRATYGDTLTRDGYHLSLTNGRLTAAMTVLKTLYPDLDLKEITLDEVSKFLVTDKMDNGKLVDTDPDYANTEANLQLIRDAVNSATADLSKAPAKLAAPKATKVEDQSTSTDLTIAQGIAPIKYFFPDVKTMSDGTIFVSAYKNIYHKPSGDAGATTDNMDEGYGTLVGWYSKDNGKTWSEEFDLVTEEKILAWAKAAEAQGDKTSWAGVTTIEGRYDLLEKDPGAEYYVIADPRDPNLAVVNVDGKELLVMTFWNAYYKENSTRSNKLYMMWAEYSNGRLGQWSQPMQITRANGGTCIKRGDIAVFPNGRILIPYYTGSYHGGIGMVWDAAKDTFVYLTDANGKRIDQSMEGVFPTDESATINEISFVAPPNSTGMVFAFVRESGEVVKSMDYGMTWEHFGNQDRTIHQPGFQVIDDDRVYVTWARSWARPRFVYGKVMYVNGSYDDTGYELVYQPPVNAGQDMGDPSSTLMADGSMLVVCYDTYYRSIVGTVVEVDSDANVPAELSTSAGKATIYEQTFQDKTLSSTPVTAQGSFGSSYTVEADFALSAGGSICVAGVTVTTSKVTADGKSADVSLAADTTTYLKVSLVGTALYVKVWQGDKEPATWTVTGSGTTGTVAVTGSSAVLKALRVTHRVAITMAETMSVTTVTAPTKLDVATNPLQSDVSWASSDPAVASVSSDGTVTFHSVGVADITITAGGVKKSCTITVNDPPAELSGKGEKVVVHSDDFQSYSGGELWDQMKQNGYNTNTTGEEGNASTLVLGSEGSNQFLTMDGKSSWIRVNEPMTGNYTVQFDFNFGGNGTLYATLNQGKGDTYETRAFVHIVKGGKTGSGTRFQYDNEAGETENYPDDPVMHGGVESLSDFGTNQWYTIKLVRAGEGLYMKLWEQGKAEPESWSQFISMPAFNTLNAANQNTCFRLQWATDGKMYIDNLSVTQQQGKGADFMLDVDTGAWYYSAVDYAIKNGIMSGYNAISFGPNDTLSRAMVVQVLYNKEGQPGLNGVKHSFPDVPTDQWFNNAVTWGSQKGVVSGFGDGKFRPNDAVTVEQVAVILHNYSGKPAAAGEPAGVGQYDDWAREALNWAVTQGVMKDVPFTNATENATRAQTAQMLMNYIEKFVKG